MLEFDPTDLHQTTSTVPAMGDASKGEDLRFESNPLTICCDHMGL